MLSTRQTAFGLAFLLWLAPAITAQQVANDAYDEAVKRYQSGDDRGAVSALQMFLKSQKNHADAWHVLGLAHNRLGNLKEARKAFEKAVTLRPDHEPSRLSLAFLLMLTNDLKKAELEAGKILAAHPQSAEAHYLNGQIKLRQGRVADALREAEMCLQANAKFANAYWLKTQALVSSYADQYQRQALPLSVAGPAAETDKATRKQMFTAAAESLEQYLKLKPEEPSRAVLQGQLEALRTYAGPNVANPVEAMAAGTRPTILYKEKATYTEEARRRGVQGTIVVMVVFSADGVVKYPLLLKSLGYGLDENVLRAVSKIRFTPATRDGKPVSVMGNLEFTFNLY